jgi:hypothetical protein
MLSKRVISFKHIFHTNSFNGWFKAWWRGCCKNFISFKKPMLLSVKSVFFITSIKRLKYSFGIQHVRFATVGSKQPIPPKVFSALFLATILLTFLAAFAYLQINGVVNSELYKFNLHFDDVWYRPYIACTAIIACCIGALVALSVTGIALNRRTPPSMGRVPKNSLTAAFFFVMTLLGLVTVFAYGRVDILVNVDLYKFSLQPGAWYGSYSFWAKVMFVSAGACAVLNVVGLVSTRLFNHQKSVTPA